MWMLLVILVVIKFYARIDTFKTIKELQVKCESEKKSTRGRFSTP